jgi:tRNA(Ile)-lysidine synthase
LNASETFNPAARLRRYLESLPRSLTSAPIVLACSGGPDSVALVLAASQLSASTRFSFVVANINHKLRGAQSDADARFVEKLARDVRFKSAVRVCRVSKASGNLEEKARDKRYDALAAVASRCGSSLILTAHTGDDQAETVFMNFLRGSGGDGLAGIPPLRPLARNSHLGRPFLICEREELHQWLRGLKVHPRCDRSNADERFLRNWLRRRLFPLLELKSPGFKERWAKLATLFQDEKEFWDDFLDAVHKQVCRRKAGGQLLDLGGLLRYSAAVQRRFLRRTVGDNLLTFDAVERLRCWMMSAPTGGRTFQLRQGWTVTRLSKSQGAPSANLFLIKGRVS